MNWLQEFFSVSQTMRDINEGTWPDTGDIAKLLRLPFETDEQCSVAMDTKRLWYIFNVCQYIRLWLAATWHMVKFIFTNNH